MSLQLKIKNFKRITDEIILKDFDFVNYFVGENGSGKSSILNAISFLNDVTNSRQFFGPQSLVELSFDGKYQKINWDESKPNKTEQIGNINPNIYLLVFNERGKGSNGLKGKAKLDSNITVNSETTLEKFNSFLSEIEHVNLTAKKIIDDKNPFNKDTGRLIFESKIGIINPEMIADGFKVLYNFKTNLKNWIKSGQNSLTLVLIEEPETNLHPNLQKQIPKLINDLYENLTKEDAKKIFFFISTHSPFIISSAANYVNQTVFPLKDGKPLIIDFKTLGWKNTNVSKCYHGSECAFVISKMLGADVTDLGYPINYCILEEYSLQIILDYARNKGIIRNIQFVSASGASKLLSLSETVNELEKIDTLIRCNPYYFDKYNIVIDNTKELEPSIKTRIEKIKAKLKNRFIELSQHSLEDYYSNLNTELANQSKIEIDKAIGLDKGRIKAEFAIKITKNIINKESFSKLFNGELDFLL